MAVYCEVLWKINSEQKDKMRLLPGYLGVVLVAFLGNVEAIPGILDFLSFGSPSVRTVYGK